MPETKPKLRRISDLYPSECAGSGVALFSSFDAYSRRFEDITEKGLGDPFDETDEGKLSNADINSLNWDIKEIENSLNSLCSCLTKYKRG